MKKGFTLVELLAVIAILAGILIISVPKILEVVEDAKVKAYQDSEIMIINAVESYLIDNQKEVPFYEGETIEISLDNLINGNYLGNISTSAGNCNGYVLITRMTEDELSYNPILKCGSTINNSVSDGLQLYYTFDDFQEPTENLVITNTLTPYGGYHDFDHDTVNNVITMNMYDAAKFIVFHNGINYQNKTLSYSGYMYENGIPVFSSNTRANTYHDVAGVSLWESNSNNGYFRITEFFDTDSIWLFHTSVPSVLDDQIVIKELQIEEKPYITPYVKGTRDGVIKDYSKNSNTATLELANTPRSIDGYYEFYKDEQKRIKLPTLNLNTKTISFWAKVKPGNHTTEAAPFLVYNDGVVTGAGDTNQILLCMQSNKFRMHGWGTLDPITSTDINDGEWHHLVWQMQYHLTDANERIMNMWVDGEQEVTDFNYDQGGDFAYVTDSYWYLGYNARAYDSYVDDSGMFLDELRFYDRMLSTEEVSEIYWSTKDLFD